MLTESDDRSSMVTTWGDDPGGTGLSGPGGDSLAGCGWVAGLFERLFAPRVQRPLYAEKLEWLDRYARTASPG